MSTVSDADIFKAALDHARQLSALRFAILTVFMTASAALFTAYFNPQVHYPQQVVAFVGFWLALVFLICELVLSYTMARQHAVAQDKAGAAHAASFAHRHGLALWSIRLAIPSLYLWIGGYWLVRLFARTCPTP